MAITYSTLVDAKTTDGSIKNWINNGSVPSTLILTMAEQWCWRRLRVRQMLHDDDTLVAVASSRYVALPADYIEGRSLRITGTDAKKLKKALAEQVEDAATYDANGDLDETIPDWWYANDTQIVFDCAADEAYPLRLVYYRQLEGLSGSNETNFLTDRASRLLFASCLAFANEFMKDDPEKERWLAIASAEVMTLNAESEAEEMRSAVIDPYVA